jgi:hypothetical protein
VSFLFFVSTSVSAETLRNAAVASTTAAATAEAAAARAQAAHETAVAKSAVALAAARSDVTHLTSQLAAAAAQRRSMDEKIVFLQVGDIDD